MPKSIRVFLLMVLLLAMFCPGALARAEDQEQGARDSLAGVYGAEAIEGYINALKTQIDEGDYTNEELDNLVDNTATEIGMVFSPEQKQAVYDFAKSYRGFTLRNFFTDFANGYNEIMGNIQHFVNDGGLDSWLENFKNAVGLGSRDVYDQ